MIGYESRFEKPKKDTELIGFWRFLLLVDNKILNWISKVEENIQIALAQAVNLFNN